MENRAHRKNALFTISPYLTEDNVLVFDDPSVGLVREPFVMGADDVLIDLAKAHGADPSHFTIIFSDRHFPKPSAVFAKVRDEMGGATYRNDEGEEGWLCPALLCYFSTPPEQLFVQVRG